MAAVNAWVIVKNNNLDFALKQLKRKLKEAGTFQKLEEVSTYEKPSAKKRRITIQNKRRKPNKNNNN